MTEREPEAGQRYLSRHKLFGHLSAEQLETLVAVFRLEHVRAGQVLFRQGDPGDRLFVVLTGRIMISKFLAPEKVNVLDIVGKGGVFGEIAMLDGGERAADATALASSRLLVIARDDFLSVLERHHGIVIRLLADLSARLRPLNKPETYDAKQTERISVRLASKLLLLAEVHGKPAGDGVRIETWLSQGDLAEMTGASRESVNQQLRSWQQQGLIALDRAHVTLLDQRRLKLNTGRR